MVRLAAFARSVYRGYTENSGGLTAAAISYFALISVVPLLLLAASVFGLSAHPTGDGIKRTLKVVQVVVPGNTSEIQSILADISKTSGTIGLVGLGTLLWIGSQFFHCLEDALNRTWHAPSSRPFWKRRLIAFCLMAIGGLLMLCSLAIGIVEQLVESWRLPWVSQELSHLPFFWHALVAYFIPLVFSIVTFTLIYRIVPNCKVSWREALVGGSFGGVLWELAKIGFGYYARTIGEAGYNRVYGSLGGLVLLAAWTYYTSNILVIGAEFARSWCEWMTPPQKPRRARRRRPAVAARPPRRFPPWWRRGRNSGMEK